MGRRTGSPALSLRESDTGAPWVVTGHRLSTDRMEETLDVVGRAGALLGWAAAAGPEQLSDHQAARVRLNHAWREVTEQLANTNPGELDQLVALLRDIKAADERVHDELLARQRRAVAVVREALAVLREADSVAELARRAPVAVSSIGFDRAVLSRIEHSVWLPETAYVAKDPGWAEEILRAGQREPRTLDGSLLETQIVRRNRPLLVNDLAERENLHRALVDSSMTRSYVAAPIVGWGQVIGFLHADCYHQRRNLDALDRDLLWMFCEGLGTLITRATALDELARLRRELGRLAGGGPGGESTTPWTVALGQTSFCPPGGMSDRFVAGRFGEGRLEMGDEPVDPELALTRRELDVLRLMSGGRTNAQIARRLVIAEGTVKSHVKHILRKLDAANRAEAVSRWLRTEHGAFSARAGDPRSRVGAT